ncbi:hypothetical protein RM553_15300 [Zunongwangia sp. F363]|uniref:Uncharacterized protein n=1 Tax=Autumnicola tepida TaxID=3075595 RepID=A0ABU3CDA3_9FLAO|nr:hypothetical protein [Zunongwangia sp. F363]MDT0644202.1 hypothetical protein [Zunongwangia sp. F363]
MESAYMNFNFHLVQLPVIAPDIKVNHFKANWLKSSGSIFILSADKAGFKSNFMSTLKNHIQLMGMLARCTQNTNLESGRKVARFSLVTND